MDKKMNTEERLQYHPAYCDATEAIFYRNRNELTFQREVSLNTLPRRIDLLVIRKEGTVSIENELGRIFRHYNLWEMKGPDAALNVSTYFDLMSYTYQYLAEYAPEADILDTSLTFLRERMPVELMAYFVKHGFEEEQRGDGLYRYRKAGHPDMQIIVISHHGVSPWYRIMAENAEETDLDASEKLFMELPEELRRRTITVWEMMQAVNGDKNWEREEESMPTKMIFEELRNKDALIAAQNAEIMRDKVQLEEKDAQIKRDKDQLEQKDARIRELEAMLEMARS